MAQVQVPSQLGCTAAWAANEPPSSLCNTYMMWQGLDGDGTCAASAAMTDHYSGVYEASTDSALSEQEALACTELLCTGDGSFLDSQPPDAACPVQLSELHAVQRNAGVGALSTGMRRLLEVQETIRNEMRRERETAPSPNYFRHHAFLSKELRETAVCWAIQVVDQFGIEQETLFLAVSYLDRFLSATEEVVHMDGLHLATLACLSLAAKQTEITQPTTSEWTWLVQSNVWGTKEQLARMEWCVLDCLEWRGCTPTAWWFLHLFCFGLGTCPAPAICMAAYLLELGLVDAGGLAFRYSSLAAASLLLGHAAVEQQGLAGGCALVMQPLTGPVLLSLAPDLLLHQVAGACKLLASLHAVACVAPAPAPDAPPDGAQLARAKYSADVWHNVGTWAAPIDVRLALARF